MIYHFAKRVVFNIKADSFEQANNIAQKINRYEDRVCGIEDAAEQILHEAINDVLDERISESAFNAFCDACSVRVSDAGYAGSSECVFSGDYNKKIDDPEKRLYDHLTEDKKTVAGGYDLKSDLDRLAKSLLARI